VGNVFLSVILSAMFHRGAESWQKRLSLKIWLQLILYLEAEL